MSKKRLLLVILVVIIIVGAGFAAYVTLPSWYPRGTTIVISPANSTVKTGSMMAFTATVKYDSIVVAGGTISWSVSDGSLDQSTGPTVVFLAPAVTNDEMVTVKASFGGNGVYQASSVSVQTMVYPNTTTTTTETTWSSTFSTTTTSSTQIPITSFTTSSPATSSSSSIQTPVTTSSTASIPATTSSSSTQTPITSSSSTTSVPPTTTSSSSSSILPYLYTMKFQSAKMTNLKALGPITMNGTSVTQITADIANLTGFSLNRVNLNATKVDIVKVQWYVTYAKFNSATAGNTLQVTGSQSVNLGPIQSAAYETGNMSVVQWNGQNAQLAGMVSLGEPVGGNEPYVPNILTATEADLSDNYFIQGPVSWGPYNNAVSSITIGKVLITQFEFTHPTSYSLDRQSHAVNFANRWIISATSVTGVNVSTYVIYFDATGLNGLVTVVASGSDDMHQVIPHGYTSGNNFPVTSIAVHTVYFSVSELSLSSFVLSIM